MLDTHLIDYVYGDYIFLNGVKWKKVGEFPAYYVNEDGDVASVMKGYFHILSYWTNHYGHHFVQLRNDHEKRKVLVHRLVAEAFIPNPFTDDPAYRHVYRTGDIVRWGNDGNVEFVGRRDGKNFELSHEALCEKYASQLRMTTRLPDGLYPD